VPEFYCQKKEEQAYVATTKNLLKKITTKEEFINLVAENITNPSQFSFISIDVNLPNLDKPQYKDLAFDAKLMNLPDKSYYENKQLTKELKTVIEHFFISIDEKNPKKKANLVFNFEKELAQKYPTTLEINKLIHSRTKISKKHLIENHPYLKLEYFLSKIPGHTAIRDIIGNQTMGFLNEKLKTASLEELKSIYLYFQLSPIMDDAYPIFFTKLFKFNHEYLGGVYKRANRQERCAIQIMNDFAKELDFILLPKAYPNPPKDKIIKLAEKVRESLIKQLATNTWLDPNTKKEAIRKIRNITILAISPNNEEEWNFNPRATYTKTTPIANNHKITKLLLNKNLAELDRPINIKRWPIGPLLVNCNYNWPYNRIIIPAGILQDPFYNPNEPEEVNLGALGTIIGHEFSHALDNYGVRFNANGVMKQWMSPKDKKIFKKKPQPLISQFNEIGHNGELTLSENIADLVGLTTAYQAAFPNETTGNKELKKRFFIQFARMWCEKPQTVERIKLRLKNRPTPPRIC